MPNPEHLMILDGTLRYEALDFDTPDEQGNPSATVTTTAAKLWLTQTARDEQTLDRDTQGQTADILLPATTTLENLVAVTVGDDRWELIGPPQLVINPRTAAASHVLATGRAAR